MNKIASSFLALAAAAFLVPLQQASRAVGAQEPPASSPQPAAPNVTVDKDVSYASVKGTNLQLDVYEPADRGNIVRPAVLLIHGGGWTDLDKSTMEAMGRFLARSGFVAFSVNYRLFHGKENQWPAQLDDVQQAVRWVRANASKYGVNPERVGALGHSAGAQLAALLGMEETRDDSAPELARYSSKVQAVVDVDGPTDFTTGNNDEEAAFLNSFLGADYAKHADVWRDASPVFHVSRQNAPFLIVHGTRDESVPIAQAQELFEKLQAANVPANFIKVDDVHTFQTPEARRQLAIETIAFFHRYLALAP